MWTLYFAAVVSFFFFFFSSPNLSGRRLDVYHTSTWLVGWLVGWSVGWSVGVYRLFLFSAQKYDYIWAKYWATWCGLSANLEFLSQMCCMQIAENTWCKNYVKNRHRRTIAPQLYRAISLQLRHVSTIGKKLVKRQYVLHMSSQYGELQPTSS